MIFSYEIFYNLYKRIIEDQEYYVEHGEDERLKDIETFKQFVDYRVVDLTSSAKNFRGFKEYSNTDQLIKLIRIMNSNKDVKEVVGIDRFVCFEIHNKFSKSERNTGASKLTETEYTTLWFEGRGDKFGCLDSIDVSSYIEHVSTPICNSDRVDSSRKANYIVPDTRYEQFYEFCVAYKDVYDCNLDELFIDYIK